MRLMNPVANYVMVKLEAIETKTASGLYLLLSKMHKSFRLKLIYGFAIGPDVKQAKPGDRIMMSQYGGLQFLFDATKYMIIKEANSLELLKKVRRPMFKIQSLDELVEVNAKRKN